MMQWPQLKHSSNKHLVSICDVVCSNVLSVLTVQYRSRMLLNNFIACLSHKKLKIT